MQSSIVLMQCCTLLNLARAGFFLISLIGSFMSCSNQKEDSSSNHEENNCFWHITSTTEWAKGSGLHNVESIIYDEVGQVFYATNGINYELGTNGFISKLSKDGELLDLRWVADLNRPTGMAIQGSILYVADVNALILINKENGKTLRKHLEPVANSGLNDVTIDQTGRVFTSASFIHSVFILNNGRLEEWCTDEEKLKWANGLYAQGRELVVAGLHLSMIDIDSKQIEVVQLDSRIQDFDGITSDGHSGYFLTTVENSQLVHFDGYNRVCELLGDVAYFGDLMYHHERKSLYVARGNKTTTEFFISEFKLKRQPPIQ